MTVLLRLCHRFPEQDNKREHLDVRVTRQVLTAIYIQLGVIVIF